MGTMIRSVTSLRVQLISGSHSRHFKYHSAPWCDCRCPRFWNEECMLTARGHAGKKGRLFLAIVLGSKYPSYCQHELKQCPCYADVVYLCCVYLNIDIRYQLQAPPGVRNEEDRRVSSVSTWKHVFNQWFFPELAGITCYSPTKESSLGNCNDKPNTGWYDGDPRIMKWNNENAPRHAMNASVKPPTPISSSRSSTAFWYDVNEKYSSGKPIFDYATDRAQTFSLARQ